MFYADKREAEFRESLTNQDLEIRQRVIWLKNSFNLTLQDYQQLHEPSMYGWKKGSGHYFINDRTLVTVIDLDKKDYTKMSKADLIKLVKDLQEPKEATTIIRENKPLKSELHPTMKPVRLMGRLIANSSRKGECVLDTFGGSGSTLIAAEQLGRKCYMMELEPKYVDVIIDRWETFTGQKARKVEG